MSAHWRAWTDVTRELGLTITPEQFLGFAGRPTSGIFASLCEEQSKTIDIPAAVELKNARYHEVADDTKLVKPVVEILQAALARGLPCAIATGGDRFQVYPSLAKSGLWTPDNTSNFKAVVTCTDVTHGKPHPETYLKAAALLGVDPADCVGYEDAPLGMESIRRAGFLAAVDVTKIPGAGPVARPRPRPSFWLAGRSLVDGGIVIDVEAQALASPTSTGLVWVRTEGSSEGDAAATNHARRTRKVRFTCNLCGTQNTKRVNPHAWHAGSVFARCAGCQGVHKLQDNLEVFFETGHAPFPPPELRQSVLGSELLERAARIWQENLRN
ncbi:Fructose-1-phosphate phosphatase YqaB [Auxenochlorella protothecoides]|uniref:Fructose-1-phosphate phosphatase YqaB n=1 Tax=Auxenochlorella protothecoides TaxID=3075 RepID=A0A087SFF6_AUXPR|nr:Fructose-1-phosphate phosphatase YqaB [Auxenochlorella protothecoides]KFM24460.1 Fructose-1-phosphate phosphatase YqaB [Auxenochlorella protothecoides]